MPVPNGGGSAAGLLCGAAAEDVGIGSGQLRPNQKPSREERTTESTGEGVYSQSRAFDVALLDSKQGVGKKRAKRANAGEKRLGSSMDLGSVLFCASSVCLSTGRPGPGAFSSGTTQVAGYILESWWVRFRLCLVVVFAFFLLPSPPDLCLLASREKKKKRRAEQSPLRVRGQRPDDDVSSNQHESERVTPSRYDRQREINLMVRSCLRQPICQP
ncbi:hypothetical protein CVT26_011761 [Gymnopilus dilepis]|uniref:Uncharacterized protein n=1 Tax=Gymnopilus dilepis TaxID=231916 RepID=A0A409WUD8_9AGAR|nr:hypothetical protein CVT26_011761 [Gymnopilus dilepis]